MIERFGVLYTGDIDLENLGYEGIPVKDRFYGSERLATGVIDKATVIAQTMDRYNWDTLWMAEHHFQPEGYECIPNIPLFSVYLASVTKRLAFGCAFNITPMWHPLRLAEDYAMADWLTNGRLKFGVGRGYSTREVETMGAPLLDQAGNRELFEEQLEIIFRAFNQERFSFHGKYFDIPPALSYGTGTLSEITLVPRPRRLPVACYQPIVSRSERGLDFMAKYGIKGFAGPNVELATIWQERLRHHGKETLLGGDLLFSMGAYIADSHAQALKEVRLWQEETVKQNSRSSFIRDLSREQLRLLEDPATAGQAVPLGADGSIPGGTGGPGLLYGPPEYIVERLQELQERFPGLTEINCGPGQNAPLSVWREQLQWFGEKVIPAVRPAAVAAD